jgi:hypothetical protein
MLPLIAKTWLAKMVEIAGLNGKESSRGAGAIKPRAF